MAFDAFFSFSSALCGPFGHVLVPERPPRLSSSFSLCQNAIALGRGFYNPKRARRKGRRVILGTGGVTGLGLLSQAMRGLPQRYDNVLMSMLCDKCVPMTSIYSFN